MKSDKKRMLGCIFVVCGIAMMLVGVGDNEHREVFEKAVRICLECIGIG